MSSNPTTGISRRAFHRRVVSIAAGGSEKPKGKYVDVHVHLTQPWSNARKILPVS